MPAALAPHIFGQHRQIDKTESRQRAEADQGDHIFQAQKASGQRHCAHQQNIVGRREGLGADVAEEALVDHAIAAHDIHQSRYTSVSRDARGHDGDDGKGQHH